MKRGKKNQKSKRRKSRRRRRKQKGEMKGERAHAEEVKDESSKKGGQGCVGGYLSRRREPTLDSKNHREMNFFQVLAWSILSQKLCFCQ